MANASYIQDAFIGGEKSQLAQGRITDREYRTWMNVCVNGHPTEAGGWVRRAGTMYASHTRESQPARVIKFDFASATPYTMEFTNGAVRFRSGTQIAFSNDAQTVLAISAATPAVVQTATPYGWNTGSFVMFSNLGANMPTLQNRQFFLTVVDSTHFSINDGITGAPINGALLGSLVGTAIVSRIHELQTPYAGLLWQTLRVVQAEKIALLLHGQFAPQILTNILPQSPGAFAQFSLGPLTFLDGPYLDPFTNGVQVNPNSLSGNVQFSLAFQAWSSTQAYKVGDFVTSASINYVSLIDNNVNLTPASFPTAWQATSAGAAINNGHGFVGTDIGRLVRLFSEPQLWLASATYVQGQIVSYNPTGVTGAATYWTSLVSSNTGNIPGNDVTHWQLASNAAIWTWGRITGLVPQIPQGSGTVIGNMIQGGGISAAFDGIITQSSAQSAELVTQYSNAGLDSTQQTLFIDGFVGKNFTGSPQQIGSVTVYGSSDNNLMFGSSTANIQANAKNITISNFQMNLRASNSAPISPSGGTLLGSTVNITGPAFLILNGAAVTIVGGPAVAIQSNDQATSWNYVWVEIFAEVSFGPSCIGGGISSNSPVLTVQGAVAEVQFFNPPGTGSGTAVDIEILGPPLLYTTPIISWRLGAYSNTTAWPTVGTYHQGRVWLGGAIDNRFDASVSNGLIGATLNMAPTDQNGTVGAANGISGVVNSDGVNPIFWFMPDLQGVIMGTQGGEWLISASAPGAISATNIDAVRVTKIGCANVEPRRTDHTTVFVQRYTKKVMEYFTDVYSGKFAAPNLAKDTMHITKPLVAELAYTQANIPVVWGRNNDGSWWGATYKRDTLATSTGPTINGWHRHILGSGRSVMSITAGPSVGGVLDALSMVTYDVATNLYHVEVMTDAVDEGDTLIEASYLDDAVNPTSVTSSSLSPAPYGGLTLNGLWHLNGKTVTAWLGGLDCGDYVVSNGSITVPYGDGISAGTANGLFNGIYAGTLSLSQMLVGFTFTSQGQLVRPATPAESGARNGPAVGKVRRNQKIAGQFEGTGVGVSFGTSFTGTLDPAKFRLLDDTPFLVNQQFTGVYKDTLTDPFSLDGMICWQITRPYPCNIANIGGFIETTDE